MISSHLRWNLHLRFALIVDVLLMRYDFTWQRVIPNALHKIVELWYSVKTVAMKVLTNFYGVLDKVLDFQYLMRRRGCLFKYRWFDIDNNKSHRTHVELGYKSINTSHF